MDGPATIGIATSLPESRLHPDDVAVARGIDGLGARALIADWHDPTPWPACDAVVVRTTWDYHHHVEDFLAWVDRCSEQAVVLNAPSLIRANVSKTYLRALETVGVDVVPTTWIDDVADLPARLGDVVVKPSIGASADGVRRFPTDRGLADHVAHLARAGPVLVQPYLPSIETLGERSIVFVDGRISHAVGKVPADGGFLVQSEFGGRIRPHTPTEDEADLARAAVDALVGAEPPPIFARVDLASLDGRPAVSEVEFVEPELYLGRRAAAVDALARAVLRRVPGVSG